MGGAPCLPYSKRFQGDDGVRRIIGVLSYKGGVGVSTVALGIAQNIASAYEKVCLVDCKRAGNLDMMLGVEDGALLGFDDLCRGMALEEVAMMAGNIRFCTAPFSKELDSAFGYRKIKESGYDCIVLDSPSDPDICTDIVLVTSAEPSSVRAAENLAFDLENKELECSLLVNRFGEFEKAVPVEEIIDRTHLKLAGIVPYVPFLFEGGASFEKDNALKNVVKRINGEDAPIFEGSKQRNRLKKILNVKQ